MTASRTDVDALVRFFCCAPQGSWFGPYAMPGGPVDDDLRTELLPGSAWRYRVADEAGLPIDLHVCAGLGPGARTLWDLEVRRLLQLGRGSPGLPHVLEGGFVDAEDTRRIVPGADGLAVVATRAADWTLADHMARDRTSAVQVFTQLAEALAELHGQGMVHGSLWPGAVHVASTGWEATHVQCRLAHFEMTSLLANHARLTGSPLPLPAQAVPYAAPEMRTATTALPPEQVARSDVYSLAAIAREWFGGAQEESSAASTPRHDRPGPSERVVPAVLQELLTRMLGPAATRPPATEVAGRLREVEHVVAVADVPRTGSPYLLFCPWEEMSGPDGELGLIEGTSRTPQGRHEMLTLIAADLRRGHLVYSPRGAAPFLPGGSRWASEARYVLIGESVAWFCRPLWNHGPFGLKAAPRDDALVLKHLVKLPSEALDALLRGSPRVKIPAVDVMPFHPLQPLHEPTLANRPSWARLLRMPGDGVPPEDALFTEAVTWLMRYQAVVPQARSYACIAFRDGPAMEVRLDRERDRARLFENPLLFHYSRFPGNRPELGDLLARLQADGPAVVELVGDLNGRPATSGHRSRWFATPTGPDRVTLRPADPENLPPPAHCWIRPADDAATAAQLKAQALAVEELRRMPQLRSQLRAPTSQRLGGDRWASADGTLPGEAAVAVREILATSPFYALQGPPGSGKTTVTAKAVAAWLRAFPNSRVLVSAQSNAAVDTLAERILTEVGVLERGGRPTGDDTVLAWRPAVADDNRVSPSTRAWNSSELTERVIRRSRATVASALAAGVRPGMQEVLQRWQELSSDPRTVLELTGRLAHSANLVFATCAMSRPSVLNPYRERDTFDWVIVEEAARAWPTELALPLTRASRWTLLGDHHQLPAHGREELERFLCSLGSKSLAEVGIPPEDRDSYRRVFDLFRNLFDSGFGPASPDRPVRRLTVQYRMAGPISQLVGEAFYPVPAAAGEPVSSGLLYGGPPRSSPPGLPAVLAGRSVVWVNTHGRPDCRDMPAWANPGEAALTARLAEQVMQSSAAPGQGLDRLAVLTPYRRQQELLLRWPALAGRVWTAHSFQGREAETVIVSLVRDTRRGTEGAEETRPWQSLGHLGRPQLVNVLLSRARSLLVLVGDFEHFAAHGTTVWGQICRTVVEQQAVIPADALFPAEEG
ncbi:AAA domain-containing protein [Streptomyces sp. NPDC058746]|uniref:AAA domain-containing protein n=1 Tax=Streptomyces sp. NPDC058746 TaxID=3346622 RepID=UPI0036A955CC